MLVDGQLHQLLLQVKVLVERNIQVEALRYPGFLAGREAVGDSAIEFLKNIVLHSKCF